MFVFNFLLPLSVQSQTVTWQKWYDYKNVDNYGKDVIQTYDGGYIILTAVDEFLNFKVSMLKLSYLGEISWQNTIDSNATGDQGLLSSTILQSIDSGFIISGYTSDSALLIKTDNYGEIKWIKKYSRINEKMRFYDHVLLQDGSIVACGVLIPSNRTIILKTDSLGNNIYTNIYNLGSAKIIRYFESNYYFYHGNSISKVDSKGVLIWTKVIGNIVEILPVSFNSIYLAGGQDSLILNEIDSSGNIKMHKSYFPEAKCFSACFSKEGNILLAGYMNVKTRFEIAVAKVDLQGNQIYVKTIDSFNNGTYYIYPNAVKKTNDYGFIFTGPTDFPIKGSDNAFGLKTDSICNAPTFTNINNNYSSISNDFFLNQNYPNPFNSSTTIYYEILNPGNIKISIFDIQGKEIVIYPEKYQPNGKYKLILNSDYFGLASGIYFLKLKYNNFFKLRKLALLK